MTDQFNDAASAGVYHQLKRMPALYDVVKTAEMDSKEAESLPDSAFAWPDARRYPIHNRPHAALSYAFAKSAGAPAPVVARIKEALDVYGVAEEIFAEKVASADPFYILPNTRSLPVASAEDVKYAEEALHAQLHRLRPDTRESAFNTLAQAAEEYGVKLAARSRAYTGDLVCDTEKTATWLEARAAATPDYHTKTAYRRLAQGVRAQGDEVVVKPDLLKVAHTITKLDEKAGLQKYYDRKLPDPYLTVFNTTKEAADCVELCGSFVPVSKIAALPASFWTELGGPELSSEIAPGGRVNPAKVAEIVDTLPMDLKAVLKSYVR